MAVVFAFLNALPSRPSLAWYLLAELTSTSSVHLDRALGGRQAGASSIVRCPAPRVSQPSVGHVVSLIVRITRSAVEACLPKR